MPYQESDQFKRKEKKYPEQPDMNAITKMPENFGNLILNNVPKNQPELILKSIDEYCAKNPLMNVG